MVTAATEKAIRTRAHAPGSNGANTNGIATHAACAGNDVITPGGRDARIRRQLHSNANSPRAHATPTPSHTGLRSIMTARSLQVSARWPVVFRHYHASLCADVRMAA